MTNPAGVLWKTWNGSAEATFGSSSTGFELARSEGFFGTTAFATSGTCRIYNVNYTNLSSSTLFLQIFDSTTIPSNGQLPIISLPAPPNNTQQFSWRMGRPLTNGLSFGFSTNYGQFTASATGGVINAEFLVDDPNSQQPFVSIGGTFLLGQSLFANSNVAVISCQWYKGNVFDGIGTFSPILNATNSFYAPTASDVGYSIMLSATIGSGQKFSTAPIRFSITGGVTLPSNIVTEQGQVGNPITSWTNQVSGSSFANVGGANPFTGRQINGYSVVGFSGSSAMLETSNGILGIIRTGSWHQFGVMTVDSVQNGGQYWQNEIVLADGNTYFSLGFANIAGVNTMGLAISSGSTIQLSASVATGSAFLFENKFDGATASIRIGATNSGTANFGPLFALANSTAWMGRSTTLKYMSGAIASLVCCFVTQSVAQTNTVRAYLGNKYGVAY